MALDDLDRRIVAALVSDGRATYAEVGAQVGLSAPAVKRRVDRLRASGAIRGFSARVDPSALGWTTEAYVELFCRGRTSPADIAAAIAKLPEVTDACTVTGDADALLHIRAADVRQWIEMPGIGYGTAPTPDGHWLLVALIRTNQVAVINLAVEAGVARSSAPRPTPPPTRPSSAPSPPRTRVTRSARGRCGPRSAMSQA